MIFTKKELAQAMGLKPGDKIKVWNTIFTINDEYSFISDNGYPASPVIFIDEEFEIVLPKKKIGELICQEVACESCPLVAVCYERHSKNTLYEALKMINTKFDIDLSDKEIYNILKSRLDKEVE